MGTLERYCIPGAFSNNFIPKTGIIGAAAIIDRDTLENFFINMYYRFCPVLKEVDDHLEYLLSRKDLPFLRVVFNNKHLTN